MPVPPSPTLERRGPVAIERRGRPPKRRGRTWALGIGLTVLALAIAAVGTVLGVAWYAEDKARTKLADLGARAGLALTVGAVVIEPYSFIEVRDVKVVDPTDGVVMATVGRVITDLTLGDVSAGKRIPGRVTLEGLEADFTDVGRWRRALERYRGAEKPKAETPAKVTLPTLDFAGATFWVPDPLSGVPLKLTEAATRVGPPSEGTRLQVAFQGLLEGRHRISLDARVDLTGQDNEAGITFDPPLAMSLGEAGPHLRIAGAYAHQGQRVRLHGLHADIPGQLTADAESVELVQADRQPFPAGVLHLEIAGATGTAFGLTGTAARVAVDVAPGSANQLPSRIRSIVVENASGEFGKALAAATVARVEVSTDGIVPSAPLSKVTEVQVSGVDVALVIPPLDQLSNSPIGRKLLSLLGQPAARGGGPAEVAPPNEADFMGPPIAEPAPAVPDGPSPGQKVLGKLRHLFGDRPLPHMVFDDASIALLAGDPVETAFVVQRFSAKLETDKDSGGIVGSITGKLHELATDEDDAFHVEGRLAENGSFEKAQVRLSGKKLARQLPRLWGALRVPDDASVHIDLTIAPTAQGHGLTVTGTGGVRNLGFFAPRIHGTPVDGLTVDGDVTASYDLDADTLTLDVPRLLIRDVLTLRLAATLERARATFAPRVGMQRRKPKLAFKLEMPRQDCGAMVKAIPNVMVPRLDGLVLDGTSEGHVTVSVDLEAPRTYEQDIDIDMRLCRPTSFGEANIPRLQTDFVQEVVEKGLPIGVTVGPGTWHYRTLDRIPKYVALGAMYTEDGSFYQHSGFRPPLMRRAVIMNLEGGRYVYGGSTITQQLVKNLFLSREKTLTRKLEEAFIVWLVERTLTKDRIIELYLNCIEYGPSIYGIENAARAYFGHHVEELDALEMAFLMGLKPYPWAGWQQFERGGVKPWWHVRLSKILIGMARSGWITKEALEAAQAVNWEPTFLTSPQRPVPQHVEPAGDNGDLPPMPNEVDAPAAGRGGTREGELDPKPGPAPFDDAPARPE